MAEEEEVVEVVEAEYKLNEIQSRKNDKEVAEITLRRLLAEGVCEISTVADNTALAFTRMSLGNKGLRSLTPQLLDYRFLRVIDFSHNQLEQVDPIPQLQHLLTLDLSYNRLQQAQFLGEDCLPSLRSLNMAGNNLKELPHVELPHLQVLNVNHNKIESLRRFRGHRELLCLELRGNKLKNLQEVRELPHLQQLFAGDNEITDTDEFPLLPSLEKLHLRKNKIQRVTGLQLPRLNYLNLRENQLSKVDQLGLNCDSLRVLNLIANPLSEELGDNTKKEVWLKLKHLNKANKIDLTSQQKQEWLKQKKEQQQREQEQREQQQKERQQKEQQQREQEQRERQQKEQEQRENQQREREQRKIQQKQKQIAVQNN